MSERRSQDASRTTYDQLPRDGNSKYHPVEPEDLEESQPGIRLTRLMDRWYLYDGRNNRNDEINPVAFASVEVSPVDSEPRHDLQGKDNRHHSLCGVCILSVSMTRP